MRANILWQPLLAILITALILFSFAKVASSSILWAVGAGALASTTCIVFAMPDTKAAQSQCIIGGYAIAIAVGWSMHFALNLFGVAAYFPCLAAIAVGLTMSLMGALSLEHPPAVGMALVLVVDLHDYHSLLVVIAGALLLALTKRLLQSHLTHL